MISRIRVNAYVVWISVKYQYDRYILYSQKQSSDLCFFVCVFQGLFHPARKVRDVYWKVYNTVYIGAQDSLVPMYPRVINDDKNQYVRYELDYILWEDQHKY